MRVRNFRLFFLGQLVSNIGTWMQLLAIPLLVLRLTDSGVALGVATALGYLPILLFGAWGGVLADRYDNRRLQLVTQAAFAGVALVLWAVVATDMVTVWMVYALSFATGLVTAVDMPTRQSFYLEMVGTADLTNAMSLYVATFTGARIVGAALGGVLIALIGVAPLFLLNGLSYLAVVAALLSMRKGELHERELVPKARGQVREGIRYVWEKQALRWPMLAMLLFFTLGYSWQVLLPLYATRDLRGGAGTFGVLMALFGVGSLVGALTMAGRSARPNARRLAWLAMALAGLTAVLATTAMKGVAYAVAPFIGGVGIAFPIVANSLLQVTSDPRMRGRVMALYTVIFLGSTPIGGPIAGWVAQQLGARTALGMNAVVAAAAGAWLLGRTARSRRADRPGGVVP